MRELFAVSFSHILSHARIITHFENTAPCPPQFYNLGLATLDTVYDVALRNDALANSSRMREVFAVSLTQAFRKGQNDILACEK